MRASLAAVHQRIAGIKAMVGSFESAGSGRGAGFEQLLHQAMGAAPVREPAAPAAPARFSRTGAGPIVGITGRPLRLHDGVQPGSVAASPKWTAPSLPRSDADWAALLPERGRPWSGAIERAARDAGVDPRLLASLVWAESAFVPDAISRSGAIGLTQLMPKTAEGLGVDPYDPDQNLDGGARYIAWTIREFGSVELGLAAYNAGPGRVRRAGGIPDIAETQAYVPKVLEYFRRLGGTT